MENFLKVFLFFIFFNLKKWISCSECDRDNPILTSNGCEMIYCSKESLESGECSVNNTIIKDQWLNDIISFDFEKLRYGAFAINSKGEMIYECSGEAVNGKRVFYGLKVDGSFLFENENGEKVPTKIIIVKDGENFIERYQSQIIFVSFNNNKECLLSIGLYTSCFELYDFEDNEVSTVSTINFTNYNIYSTVSSLMKNNNDNFQEYFYTFIGQEKEDQSYHNFYLIFQNYTFSSNKISLNEGYNVETKINMYLSKPSRIISSCKTDSNLIILFYTNNNNFILEVYNSTFQCTGKTNISNVTSNNDIYDFFYKSIYIKDNIVALIFYQSSSSDPQFRIIDVNDDGASFNIKFNKELNNPGFTSNTQLNDLIKINNNRVHQVIEKFYIFYYLIFIIMIII